MPSLKLAIRNHRSMQEQVRYAQVGAVDRARQWRSVLARRNFSDLSADIRAHRSRCMDVRSSAVP
ncbi:MAG: hypothetical protein ACKOPT_09030 [Cyanobium sp.]